MFTEAKSFNRDLDAWDTSSVTDMQYMFNEAHVFNGKVGSWDVSKVTTLSHMFYNAKKFNQPVGNWDVSKVTAFDNAFAYASAFAQDLSKWTGSGVETTQSNIFYGATAFQAKYWCPDANSGPIKFCQCKADCPPSPSPPPSSSFEKTAITTDNIKTAAQTCLYSNIGAHVSNGLCAATEYGSMPDWDVSKVTSMRELFGSILSSVRSQFNADLSRWDVSAVTDMQYLFNGCTAFNGDISNWDVSSVTRMQYMFQSTRSFTRDINSWNIQRVTSFEGFLYIRIRIRSCLIGTCPKRGI